MILVANVMSMAGGNYRGLQRLVVAMPWMLLSLYPLVWIALYTAAWWRFSRGSAGIAYALSAIPLAVGIAGVFLISRPASKQMSKTQMTVNTENPLVWTILCAGGSRRGANLPMVPIEQALTEIVNSTQINVPVQGYGTPLMTALMNLNYEFDGSPADRHQSKLELLVRTLEGRGARLSAEEAKHLRATWLLRRAMHEGPITTRAENLLVYRILQTADPRGPYIRDGKRFALEPGDAALLNVPTKLHGTPLYAALLVANAAAAKDLYAAGARLTAAEAMDPAVSASLGVILGHASSQ